MKRALGRLRHAVRQIRARTHPHHFFSRSEQRRIVAAIQHAERETSGQIRVHVEGRCAGDAMARARQVFAALGMQATARRNGALLYLAVRDRTFAVAGDEGIHAVVPRDFWARVRDGMTEDFRRARFCQGLCHGIGAIGAHLKIYFPAAGSQSNELPDEISEGEE